MGEINLEKQLNSVVEIGNFDVQESLDNKRTRNKVWGYMTAWPAIS